MQLNFERSFISNADAFQKLKILVEKMNLNCGLLMIFLLSNFCETDRVI
jgi:hypothetical protein